MVFRENFAKTVKKISPYYKVIFYNGFATYYLISGVIKRVARTAVTYTLT